MYEKDFRSSMEEEDHKVLLWKKTTKVSYRRRLQVCSTEDLLWKKTLKVFSEEKKYLKVFYGKEDL